jgi:hypothetical protein
MVKDTKKSSLLMDIGQGFSLMLGLPSITSWKTSGRPKKPKRGTFGFNSQTNNLEYYNGSHWLGARLSKI